MKKWLCLIACGALTIVYFQNCSPRHISGNSGSFELSSLYPYYDSKPEYFESIQLTEVQDDGGTWRYQFVATIVYVDDPSQDVNVDIQVFDGENNALCSRTSVTVNQNTNHILISDCQSSAKVNQVNVSMAAKLNSDVAGTLQKVKDYVFDIE